VWTGDLLSLQRNASTFLHTQKTAKETKMKAMQNTLALKWTHKPSNATQPGAQARTADAVTSSINSKRPSTAHYAWIPKQLIGIALLHAAVMVPVQAQNPEKLFLLPTNADPSRPSHRLAWNTRENFSYVLEKTNDLADPGSWEAMTGFPRSSESSSDNLELDLDEGRAFFRLKALDEEGPRIVRLIPAANDFSVPRGTPIQIELADDAGIDPDSISLSVAGLTDIDLDDERLTFDNDVLTLDLDGAHLGDWGDTIHATVQVADVLGNPTEHSWAFDLETETEVAAEIFVFGSPQADASGQIDPDETGTDGWWIDEIEEDAIFLGYRGTVPDLFTSGMLICNQQPGSPDEIFYREIVGVQIDTDTSRIELITDDRELTDFILNGSISTSGSPDVREYDAPDGEVIAMANAVFHLPLPQMNASLAGQPFIVSNDLELAFANAGMEVIPYLYVAAEITNGQVNRFSVTIDGIMRSTLDPGLVAVAADEQNAQTNLSSLQRFIRLTVGSVPVFIDVSAQISAMAEGIISGAGSLAGGFEGEHYFWIKCDYDETTPRKTNISSNFSATSEKRLPFTFNLNGEAEVEVGFEMEMEIILMGSKRFAFALEPGYRVSGGATEISPGDIRAAWQHEATGLASFEFEILGGRSWKLIGEPIYDSSWETCVGISPNGLVLGPQAAFTGLGGRLELKVKGCFGAGIQFQWFHQGKLIPGVTGDRLLIDPARRIDRGEYHVRALINGEWLQSNIVTASVGRMRFGNVADPDECLRVTGVFQINYEPISSVSEPEIVDEIDLEDGGTYQISLYCEELEPGALKRQNEFWDFDCEANRVTVRIRGFRDEGVAEYSGFYDPDDGFFSIRIDSPGGEVSRQEGPEGIETVYFSRYLETLQGYYDPLTDSISGEYTSTVTNSWSNDGRTVSCVTDGVFYGR